MHDPLKLFRRIQVLYMAVTGLPHPYGAQAWMARKLNIDPRTLRKWCRPADAGGADPTVRASGRRKLSKLKEFETRQRRASRGSMEKAVWRLNKFERERPAIETSKQAYFRKLGKTEVRDA